MHILPDETAGSLVFRLAQHRQQSVSDFCAHWFDLNLPKARSDLDQRLPENHLATLAKITKISLAEAESLRLPRATAYSVWNRQTLSYCGSIRACPRCLTENKYGRRFWRSRLAAVCLVHGIELISACPHCRSGLPYFGDMAGIVTQFWLESWPTCPICLRMADVFRPANPALCMMSRRWASAFVGRAQNGYPANDFLQLSVRILDRFSTMCRYKQAAQLVAPKSDWTGHIATALVLRSLLRERTPMSAAYAALGLMFQPDQLAKEIMV